METKEKAAPSVMELKEMAAEAKIALRKYKQANRPAEGEELSDEIKAEIAKLEANYEVASQALQEARETKKSSKEGVGSKLYGYGKIKDATTGEERELTKTEEKRWRTHARKFAKKNGGVASQVPFDPDFFTPKVKAEKPAKEKVAKEKSTKEVAKEVAKDETPTPKPLKKIRRAED
jgi:hypothetical protein